ncbi:MAG: hypothetical protein HND48_18990 [Chloroflexi bacterium]|nr:hypothetical protein [Chloroflexota bacterium]
MLFLLWVSLSGSIVHGQSTSSYSLAWSPDGSYLAISVGNDVEVRDNTGQLLNTLTDLSPGNVWELSWSADGQELAVATESSIQVWNRPYNASEALLRLTLTSSIPFLQFVEWSPNGQMIVAGGRSTRLDIWNANTGQYITSFNNTSSAPVDLAWSPDSSRIAVGQIDVVTIWALSTGAIESGLAFSNSLARIAFVKSLAWDPAGEVIVASTGEDSAIWLWNTLNQDREVFALLTEGVRSLDWSPLGDQIVGSGFDGYIRVWDVSSRQMLQEIYTGSVVLSVAWKPDGQIFAFGATEGSVQFVARFEPPPTATPTPAPTQTGGGGQIAYDGGCTPPGGMTMLGAICGLNVSGGDTFYLTTGDDPALASGNRVASGECTQSHIPPEG